MFLSDLSIRRPVLAAVMMLALVTLGIFSYRQLPVDLQPNIDMPIVTIITPYAGATAETIERDVTQPIEQAINTIAGIKKVMSTSKEGVSTIIAQFELEVSVSDAAAETRAKIAAIRGDLPRDIQDPIIQKISFAGFPVTTLALQSDTLPATELTRLADRVVKRRLESQTGVGQVLLVGDRKREIAVEIDPARLESLGLGIDEVVAGLRAENSDTPLGRVTGVGAELPLRIKGKPEEVAGLSGIVVAQRGGRGITLGEVARVVDGAEEPRSLALVNGVPAVAIEVIKQSGANTIQVVDEVRRQVALLQAALPVGARLSVVSDTSTQIRESIHDLARSILLGGALTILIVFCFLNSWRSTVITGLTLPISIISSFIVMNFMHMSLNMMTLMALSLAIGLLIDDAIVVRENIVRHMKMGKDHMTASREGTNEIGLAVIATTSTIIAVFLPVAFMKGIVGRFFFQFGMSVAFAVLVSLFVSFTLDPMLSSRWTDPALETHRRRRGLGRLLEHFNNAFERLAEHYRGWIRWSIGHRKTIIAAAIAAFVAGLAILSRLGGEFVPEFDRGEFSIGLKMAPDASYQESEGRLRAVLEALKQIPEIQRTYASIGAGEGSTVREVNIYVKLVGSHERQRTQEMVSRAVRRVLAAVPGLSFSVSRSAEGTEQKPLQVQVRGPEIAKLKEYAAELKRKMLGIRGLVDLDMSMEFDQPEFRMIVDRSRAADAGISSAELQSLIRVLVGGEAVSTFEDEEGEAIDVRVRLPEALRNDAARVLDLRLAHPAFLNMFNGMGSAMSGMSGLSSMGGGDTLLLPVRDFVRLERATSPDAISRERLSRQVLITANLEDLPLAQGIAEVKKEAATLTLDPGYTVEFGGEAEDMMESFHYLIEALLLCVVAVYLVLAAQFESFLDPFSIMLSLPLSILGMAAMLWVSGDTINIISLIGLIMLMGLVTKNAILLVDHAKQLRRGGMDRASALVESGRVRLRPIMMTTLAMILGMTPLALGLGQGAEWRAPMGRAVIGGLMTSTLLTLFVVPVVYTLIDDVAKFLVRLWKGRRAAETAEERAPQAEPQTTPLQAEPVQRAEAQS